MTPERLEQIEALYNDVLVVPRNERKAFLNRTCGNDDELRAEIESLLACEDRTDTYLEKPALQVAAESLANQGGGLLVGQTLGRYQLLSLVGRGGMGDVYCAVDSRLNRIVAVKILPSYFADDHERSQRFEQEARVIALLNHPHICILHDAGCDNGTYYLVFEYLVGESLSERLVRGPLTVSEALQYAIQITEALEHAHQQGIIHHDLKPSNIMLTKAGVKLLDFGIAELRYQGGAEPKGDQLLYSLALHSTSGTLAYMAPEQIKGGETDVRTDIFAFGVLMSEMITGQPAFLARSELNLVASISNGAALALSQAESQTLSALETLIRRCLAEDPSQRWQSTSDLLPAVTGLANTANRESAG